jgi:hypothetical protein
MVANGLKGYVLHHSQLFMAVVDSVSLLQFHDFPEDHHFGFLYVHLQAVFFCPLD